jgi:large exoprotein involved in heme utilization and adhesion
MKIWSLKHSTIFSFTIFTFGLQAAYAKIIPDRTMGTIVAPHGMNDIINGGAYVGNNLFHSFTEFNINTGRGVYYYFLTRSFKVRRRKLSSTILL